MALCGENAKKSVRCAFSSSCSYSRRVPMVRNQKPKGQSAVEFLLAAPLLFLLFFLIIQSAYLGLTALALQRAAMAGAREIGLTGVLNDQNIRLKIAVSLAPLAYLNQAAFIGLLN